MSQPVASGNSRRMFALSVPFYTVVLPLAQAALGYVAIRASRPWFWLAGTPGSYLLIGGIGGFWATGRLAARQARGRGALLGTIGGAGGALVAALIAAVIIVWNLNAPHPPPSHLGPGGPTFLVLVVIVLFVPAFLGVNLLGIALALLGGMLGGTLRANARRGEHSAGESPQGRERASGWIAAAVIAAALAILAGVAALALSSGAVPALR